MALPKFCPISYPCCRPCCTLGVVSDVHVACPVAYVPCPTGTEVTVPWQFVVCVCVIAEMEKSKINSTILRILCLPDFVNCYPQFRPPIGFQIRRELSRQPILRRITELGKQNAVRVVTEVTAGNRFACQVPPKTVAVQFRFPQGSVRILSGVLCGHGKTAIAAIRNQRGGRLVLLWLRMGTTASPIYSRRQSR